MYPVGRPRLVDHCAPRGSGRVAHRELHRPRRYRVRSGEEHKLWPALLPWSQHDLGELGSARFGQHTVIAVQRDHSMGWVIPVNRCVQAPSPLLRQIDLPCEHLEREHPSVRESEPSTGGSWLSRTTKDPGSIGRTHFATSDPVSSNHRQRSTARSDEEGQCRATCVPQPSSLARHQDDRAPAIDRADRIRPSLRNLPDRRRMSGQAWAIRFIPSGRATGMVHTGR